MVQPKMRRIDSHTVARPFLSRRVLYALRHLDTVLFGRPWRELAHLLRTAAPLILRGWPEGGITPTRVEESICLCNLSSSGLGIIRLASLITGTSLPRYPPCTCLNSNRYHRSRNRRIDPGRSCRFRHFQPRRSIPEWPLKPAQDRAPHL